MGEVAALERIAALTPLGFSWDDSGPVMVMLLAFLVALLALRHLHGRR
jgi:hypothetical protein